jgi:hypothetical protein
VLIAFVFLPIVMQKPNLAAAMHSLAKTAHGEDGLCDSIDEAMPQLRQQGVAV